MIAILPVSRFWKILKGQTIGGLIKENKYLEMRYVSHDYFRPVISEDFSRFQNFIQIFLCHQGKKEVACIVSSSFLFEGMWGCGESVNPPKLNIQEVQGALSSRPKGGSGLLPIFQDFFSVVKSHPWYFEKYVILQHLYSHHLVNINVPKS